jgi:hypothetical protein
MRKKKADTIVSACRNQFGIGKISNSYNPVPAEKGY